MDIERSIQAAIVRADLFILSALKSLFFIAILSIIVIGAVLFARSKIQNGSNYPSYDITSEGPEGYTENWYKF